MKYKKFKLPISIKLVNDNTDYVVPLSIMFLAIVVSATIILLAIA